MTEAAGAREPATGGGKGGLIVLVVVIALVVGGVVVLRKKAVADAEKSVAAGKAAFEAKKWEEAYTLLEKGLTLKDDPQGKSMAGEARKHHRDELVAEAGKATDPEAGLAALEKANGISPDPEVAAKIEAARYAAGKQALEAKKFDRAFALLSSIPAYKDAKALADVARAELDYAEAERHLERAREALKAGKLGDAIAAVTSAEAGGDKAPAGKPPISAAAAKVKDELHEAATQSKEDEQALVVFRALGGHKDAPDRVKALEPKVYGAAKDAMHRNDLARAKALLVALGSYKESQALLKEIEARAGTPKESWAKVGQPREYKGTRLMVALDDRCWTVDAEGTLSKTNAEGVRTSVGKRGDWSSTVAVVAMDSLLYSVEKDGTLYKTDKNGKYDQVGKGSLGAVRALVALDGALYSLEGGDLFRTEVATGKWQPVGGRGEWKDTRLLTGLKGKIWSVKGTSGSLHRTKPNGNSEKVGKDGDWKEAEWMVAAGDFIYSIQKDGTLHRTDASGTRKQVGEVGGFKDTVGIAAEGETVWTIEADGTLYRTTIKSS